LRPAGAQEPAAEQQGVRKPIILPVPMHPSPEGARVPISLPPAEAPARARTPKPLPIPLHLRTSNPGEARGPAAVPKPARAEQVVYNSWSEVPDRPPAGVKMFVEIFAGEAGTTSALRKLGVPCLPPVDLVVAGECKESTDVHLILEKIKTWIKEGGILAVHFGTPCTTYSAARKNDGGPKPLRTKKHLKGVPGLTGKPDQHDPWHQPHEADSRPVPAVPKTAQSALDNREPGKQSDLVNTRV
jgi:hypothetical protein